VKLNVLGDDGSVSGTKFLEDWRERLGRVVHFLHRRSPNGGAEWPTDDGGSKSRGPGEDVETIVTSCEKVNAFVW
jgi:hypothetical protein